jgi:predicted kinase
MAEQRSVKIGADERGGWSSDRPRRGGGGPERPADISVRCRVLAPTDRLRYTPTSLVVLVGGSKAVRDAFAQRVLEDRTALLSLDRVRALLQGKVPDAEVEARAGQLLAAAVDKRLQSGQPVVVAVETPDPAEREPFVRAAARLRRPRHLVLVEAPGDQVDDELRPQLNDLRRALEAGELGAEGFHTALRLGGPAIGELKRLVFREPPPEDE